MIAQDTGGAIVGPARADLYFGAGDEAASVSGRLRHDGRFVMLMPKEVDPSAEIDEMPLPRPRPPIRWPKDKPTPEKRLAAHIRTGQGESANAAKPAEVTSAKMARKPTRK